MKVVKDNDIKIENYNKAHADIQKVLEKLAKLRNTLADTDYFISDRIKLILDKVEQSIKELKNTDIRIKDEIKLLEKEKLEEENSIF